MPIRRKRGSRLKKIASSAIAYIAALFVTLVFAAQGAGAIEKRHFFGLDTQAAFSLGANAENPDSLFDLTTRVNRASFHLTYGPPLVYVRFRLGAALNPGAVFSLFAGVDVPIYEKLLSETQQRLFALVFFADADFPFAAPYRQGFDAGLYASINFSLTGLSVGARVNQDGLILPFVSYTGAYYAGNKEDTGVSE